MSNLIRYHASFKCHCMGGGFYTSLDIEANSSKHAEFLVCAYVRNILKGRVVHPILLCEKENVAVKLNKYTIDYVDFDEHGRLKKKIIVESNTYDNALVEFYTLTGLPKSYINHIGLEVYNRSESGLEAPKPKAFTNKYIVKYVVGCSGSVVISNVIEKSILATSQDEVLNYLANTGHPDRPITVLSIIVDSRA